jgi:hypothetical protein
MIDGPSLRTLLALVALTSSACAPTYLMRPRIDAPPRIRIRTEIEGGVMSTTKNRPHRCFHTAVLVTSALSAALVACSIDTPDIDDDDPKKPSSSSSGGNGIAQSSAAAGAGMPSSSQSSGPGGDGGNGGSGGTGGSGGGPSAQEICQVGCANVYYCGFCIVDADDQCVDEATCTQSCLGDPGLQDVMYCAASVQTCEELATCSG